MNSLYSGVLGFWATRHTHKLRSAGVGFGVLGNLCNFEEVFR